MANGTSCCAQEVCCDPPAARAKVKAKLIAMGADAAYCDLLFTLMDQEDLMFTSITLRPFIAEIVAMAQKHAAGK